MAGTAAAVSERRWGSGSLYFSKRNSGSARPQTYGRIFVPTEAVWLAANENHRNQNEAPILTRGAAYATIIDELRTMPLLRRSVLLRLRRRGVVCRHETHDAKTFETGRNSE